MVAPVVKLGSGRDYSIFSVSKTLVGMDLPSTVHRRVACAKKTSVVFSVGHLLYRRGEVPASRSWSNRSIIPYPTNNTLVVVVKSFRSTSCCFRSQHGIRISKNSVALQIAWWKGLVTTGDYSNLHTTYSHYIKTNWKGILNRKFKHRTP